MRPIRIVHLIDGLTIGGAEMMLCKLVTRMDRARFANVVVSFMDGGSVGRSIEAAGTRVVTLGVPRGGLSVGGMARLLRVLASERPAVLQTWSKAADFVGLVAGRAIGLRNVVWNVRGSGGPANRPSSATRFCERACEALSRRPALILANSQVGQAAHHARGYRPKAWRLIPNGFDVAVFRPDQDARREVRRELGLPQQAIAIGSAGRYHPVKDFLTFGRAVAIAAARHEGWHFVLAGAGLAAGNSELLPVLQGSEAEGRVHLLGERADMPRILAALDLFTLTSLSEGFPNVVGEAMACGVPCIVAATAGDAPAIVAETGMVVPARDPAALVAAWETMLAQDQQARAALGRAARRRIQDRYSLDGIVSEYEALYATLATGGA